MQIEPFPGHAVRDAGYEQHEAVRAYQSAIDAREAELLDELRAIRSEVAKLAKRTTYLEEMMR